MAHELILCGLRGVLRHLLGNQGEGVSRTLMGLVYASGSTEEL